MGKFMLEKHGEFVSCNDSIRKTLCILQLQCYGRVRDIKVWNGKKSKTKR